MSSHAGENERPEPYNHSNIRDHQVHEEIVTLHREEVRMGAATDDTARRFNSAIKATVKEQDQMDMVMEVGGVQADNAAR